MKYLGVDYYPEQWGMDLVDDDLNNIVELGANLIRIGDFAWDLMEPEDGRYDFSFFDEVIHRAKGRMLRVLMCVPSATMPSWLYEAHPEIMNVDEKGYRQPFGARRGYCVNSSYYLQKVTALAEAMAMHYKDEVAIVAWQVDNEIGHEGSDVCYCDSCKEKFHQYLQRRYPEIEDLNKRWGTTFWGQTYQHHRQIPLPTPSFTAHNPSLRLEWARFRNRSTVNYISTIVNAIRKIDHNHPITHDFEGGTINKFFNPFDVARDLDFVSYNNYPVWGGQRAPLSDSDLAFTVDFARGFKRDKIWITEAIMGAQGHNDIGYAPRPDEAKKWALDSLKHGVESLIFFRYRGFTKGAEQFCFGILDADNMKRRKFQETKTFFREARAIDDVYPKAKAAIVYDYDSKCSMLFQRQSDAFDYEQECMKLYNQLYRRHQNCDIIDSSQDFSAYKLLILPYMIVMDDGFKERIRDFITSGGRVVMTPRTAWKDKDNNLVFGKRLPVDVIDLTGSMIEEHETLLQGQSVKVNYFGEEGEGYVFAEMLIPTTGRELVAYQNNPFGRFAAATVNEYGLGRCYYLGTSFDEKTLTSIFEEILNT